MDGEDEEKAIERPDGNIVQIENTAAVDLKEHRKFKVGEDEFPVYIAYKNLTEDVPYMKVNLDQKKIAELQKVAKQCVHA